MLDDTGRVAPSRDCSRAVRRGARIESADRTSGTRPGRSLPGRRPRPAWRPGSIPMTAAPG